MLFFEVILGEMLVFTENEKEPRFCKASVGKLMALISQLLFLQSSKITYCVEWASATHNFSKVPPVTFVRGTSD
jgi:hypothetical protein